MGLFENVRSMNTDLVGTNAGTSRFCGSEDSVDITNDHRSHVKDLTPGGMSSRSFHRRRFAARWLNAVMSRVHVLQ